MHMHNGDRLTDIENKFLVTRREREGRRDKLGA